MMMQKYITCFVVGLLLSMLTIGTGWAEGDINESGEASVAISAGALNTALGVSNVAGGIISLSGATGAGLSELTISTLDLAIEVLEDVGEVTRDVTDIPQIPYVDVEVNVTNKMGQKKPIKKSIPFVIRDNYIQCHETIPVQI